MSAKPVFRLQRTSTAKDVSLMARHWVRGARTPNADPELRHLNRALFGAMDPTEGIEAKLATLDKPPRKDACLAVEGIATLSREWFLTDGKTDPAKVDAFADATLAHLHKQYPGQLAGACLHMDETTPHLHFVLVPIVEKMRAPPGRAKDKTPRLTRSLSADHLIGGKQKLSEFHQEAFEQAMSALGVGPRTRKILDEPDHTSIKHFYKQMPELQAEALKHRNDARATDFKAGMVLTHASLARQEADKERQEAKQDRALAATDRQRAAAQLAYANGFVAGVEAIADGRIIDAAQDGGRKTLVFGVKDEEKARLERAIAPAHDPVWETTQRFVQAGKGVLQKAHEKGREAYEAAKAGFQRWLDREGEEARRKGFQKGLDEAEGQVRGAITIATSVQNEALRLNDTLSERDQAQARRIGLAASRTLPEQLKAINRRQVRADEERS